MAILAAVYALTSIVIGRGARPFIMAVMFAASRLRQLSDADRLPDQHVRLL